MFYIVATPIGNLKDISLRALEVLKEVDFIACEDTRHSLKLLNHYEIKKPLFSYHKFNEKGMAEKIIDMLLEGKNGALITDAGTPLISDPGSVLVKELIKANQSFTAIPGACAIIDGLCLSGLSTEKFAFLCFLPEKEKERNKLLKSVESFPFPMVFYSAPHDLVKNIGYLYSNLGERTAVILKELTKIHETRLEINLKDNYSGETKGEYVIIVDGKNENDLNKLSEKEHIDYYINLGLDKKQALKKVAEDRNVSKSSLYKYTIE